MLTYCELLLLGLCIICVKIDMYFDMKRKKNDIKETEDFEDSFYQNNRKVKFSKKNQVKYYYLSPEERDMKRKTVRKIAYKMKLLLLFKKYGNL